MRTLVVGLGTQGAKRIKFIEDELAGSVDPVHASATYSEISEAPLDLYDAVFLCVPDKEKRRLIEYCIENKKHVLVEKPAARSADELKTLLSVEPAFTIDYAEFIDLRDFTHAKSESREVRAIVAGWINGIRLIANIKIDNIKIGNLHKGELK